MIYLVLEQTYGAVTGAFSEMVDAEEFKSSSEYIVPIEVDAWKLKPTEREYLFHLWLDGEMRYGGTWDSRLKSQQENEWWEWTNLGYYVIGVVAGNLEDATNRAKVIAQDPKLLLKSQ